MRRGQPVFASSRDDKENQERDGRARSGKDGEHAALADALDKDLGGTG
jgi:hypothetical protein